MILYPPERWDSNEWFVIFSAVTAVLASFLLPKRFSPAMIAFILLSNVWIGQTTDFLIGVPPYDLYDVNDSPKYEVFDFLLYFFSYPPVMYIVLCFYARRMRKGVRLFFFIGGCSLLITGLEWLARLAHVFTYKGWHIYYSFFVYFGVIVLNILLFHFAQCILRRKSASRRSGR